MQSREHNAVVMFQEGVSTLATARSYIVPLQAKIDEQDRCEGLYRFTERAEAARAAEEEVAGHRQELAALEAYSELMEMDRRTLQGIGELGEAERKAQEETRHVKASTRSMRNTIARVKGRTASKKEEARRLNEELRIGEAKVAEMGAKIERLRVAPAVEV